MQELNIFYTAVGGIPTPVVTAMELHKQVSPETPYNEWVVRMIRKHNLLIGRDYFQSLVRIVEDKEGKRVYSTLHTITLTLDTTRKIQNQTKGATK